MQYNRLLIFIAVAGCQPNYISGKTQCSDKKECPSGYSCSDDGTNSTHYCIDNTKLSCPSTYTFYCSQSNTCWLKPGACSTVTYCGTAKNPDYVLCATAGYVPDCNGTTCSPGSAEVTGGSKDAGVGAGGAGGSGGIKTTVVGTGGIHGTGGSIGGSSDAGIPRDASAAEAAPDGVGRDLGATCTSTCPTGQQCLSGQCCVPPAAGGDCTAYPLCGCPSGSVCYPSSTTHAMACFTATNLAEGADCTGSLICQAGLGCFGGVCKRYCSTDSDCPSIGGVQNCDQTIWSSDNTSILGVMVCDRICDPAHPQSPTPPLLSCPTGFNCSSDSTGLSYCFKASPLPTGSSCTTEGDCPAGSYCTTAGSCNRYCLTNSDCSAGTTCQFTWSPSEYAGSTKVGYCK